MKTRSQLTNKKGFTLIEVMITLAILATLSVLVAQTIRAGVRNKAVIQEKVNSLSRLRDAFRILEKDIHMAYHYRDIELEIAEIIKKPTTPVTPGTPPAPVVPREAERKDPATHFIGLEKEMNFVTMNTGRLFAKDKTTDMIEVGYAVKDCKSISNPSTSNTKCLWRRTATLVDDDVKLGGKEVVLLENVEEFKLRYFGKGKQEFNTQWRTDAGGDAATKNKFPALVEISITTLSIVNDGEKAKKYSMQIVVPIHFANNPEDKPNATP